MFPFLVCVQKFIVDSFSLADIKDIKEFGQRLRIVRTGASTDHNGILVCPVSCVERDLAEIEDLENICIAHLELDRNAEEVKIPYRVL